MTTFALVHGSGDGGWAWHLVGDALRRRGHGCVAPDLPTDREDATWADCVETVVGAVDAAGPGDDVVVVGHSSGAFVAPLAAARLGAPQVLVAGMVPWPGESPEEWFDALDWPGAVAAAAREDGGRTGHPDPMVVFFHDVPADLAREAVAHERATGAALGATPWPTPTTPAVRSRYVVTTRDRFLPPAVQHRAAKRLRIADPARIAAGHCAHLSRPEELADLLVAEADGLATQRP